MRFVLCEILDFDLIFRFSIVSLTSVNLKFIVVFGSGPEMSFMFSACLVAEKAKQMEKKKEKKSDFELSAL